MHEKAFRLSLWSVIVVVVAGCGPSVRPGQIGIVADGGTTQSRGLSTMTVRAMPVEYIWYGGAHITGVSIYHTGQGLVLKGRASGESPSMMSASRLVRIEAVNASREILWSACATIDRDHKVGWRRSRTGQFKAGVPDLTGINHFHIGVVARSKKQDRLLGTCLSTVNL